jgi:hypothetical protein
LTFVIVNEIVMAVVGGFLLWKMWNWKSPQRILTPRVIVASIFGLALAEIPSLYVWHVLHH